MWSVTSYAELAREAREVERHNRLHPAAAPHTSHLSRCLDGDAPVGVVRRLVGLPSCEVLEVEREGAGDLLVPMVRDAIRRVDVAAGVIDVDVAFLGEQAG